MNNNGDTEPDDERRHREAREADERKMLEQNQAFQREMEEEKKKTRTVFQAERLRQARIAAGFKTATEAAQKFGFVESTYLAHENGSRGAPAAQMGAYARAFGVGVGYLMFGQEVDTTGSRLRPDLLRIRGFIQRGQWHEGNGLLPSTPETRSMTIPVVPDKRYFKADQYAVRVDYRLRPIASAGDCLIIADWDGLEQERRAGLIFSDFYLMRRSRGDLHSLMAWRGDWIRDLALEAGETDPDDPFRWTLTKPMEDGRYAAGEHIKIMGLVIGKYTPKEAIAAPTA